MARHVALRHAPRAVRPSRDGPAARSRAFVRDRSGEVDAYKDVDQLEAHVEWPDVSDGEYTDAVTTDGHVLELIATPHERVVVRVTGTVDPALLRTLARAAAVPAGLPADLDAASVWRAVLPPRRR